MKTLASLPPGVTILRDLRLTGVSILECRHEAGTVGKVCVVCRAPNGERRPVKLIAELELRAEQGELF